MKSNTNSSCGNPARDNATGLLNTGAAEASCSNRARCRLGDPARGGTGATNCKGPNGRPWRASTRPSDRPQRSASSLNKQACSCDLLQSPFPFSERPTIATARTTHTLLADKRANSTHPERSPARSDPRAARAASFNTTVLYSKSWRRRNVVISAARTRPSFVRWFARGFAAAAVSQLVGEHLMTSEPRIGKSRCLFYCTGTCTQAGTAALEINGDGPSCRACNSLQEPKGVSVCATAANKPQHKQGLH